MASLQTTRGRSSSQTSIYDYPEHLNPFYEDENHKRLRFWKISRKPGRSNSFSFSGLKDMWARKSFTLKKKSSTLGINKTSESPPPLHKAFDYETNNNSIRGNDFERNASYRSSLQYNMQSPYNRDNEMTFPRNSRYRSTIQNGNGAINNSGEKNRYTYGGSVTPTPRSKHITAGWTPSSSQISLNSVNPFDEDEATNAETGAQNTAVISSKHNVLKRPARKKYRAPPPPVLIRKNENYLNETLRIDEGEQKEEITNLSNEIESFVRTVIVDDAVAPNKKIDEENEIRLEKEESRAKENGNIVSIKEHSEIPKIEYKETTTNTSTTTSSTTLQTTITHNETNHKDHDKTENSNEWIIPKPVEEIDDIKMQENSGETVELRVNEANRNEETLYIPTTVNELRISEESAATMKTSQSSVAAPAAIHVHLRTEATKIVAVPPPAATPSATSIVVEQTADADADSTEDSNLTLGRRRSVKEIIDSINKSQSLLKLNHESETRLVSQTGTESNDSMLRNIQELTESEKQIKQLLSEMETVTSLKIIEDLGAELSRKSYYDNIPDDAVAADGEPAPIPYHFEKCKMREKTKHDWNPVPKPRRSHHFEANNSLSATNSSTTVVDTKADQTT